MIDQLRVIGFVLALLGSGAAAQTPAPPPGDEPAPAPTAKPAPTPDADTPTPTAAPQPAGDPRVDAILTQLEARGEAIHNLHGAVRLVEVDKINLSQRVKKGEVLFDLAEPQRFLVRFDKTFIDDQQYGKEWYLFDGQWLHEANQRLKKVTRRQIARPGEHVDFFDLETAPFPLPFGQRKDQILEQFLVAWQPPAEGDPPNTDHLICVPRPQSRLEGEYDKLEFYVLRDLHLPRRIVITRNSGYEIITAEFPDLTEASLNQGLGKDTFTPPKEWKQYETIVEPIEPAKPAADPAQQQGEPG